ncbi:unnamed protein product [Caenorhabditis nigoni]
MESSLAIRRKNMRMWRQINEDQGVVIPEDNPEEENLENWKIDQSLPTCNICMLNYSNPTVIPLILIGCGHTFFEILVNGIKLSNQEEEVEEERPINENQGTVIPEKNPEDENLEIDQTLPTCNICMLNYSNPTVIPLILIGCGHTAVL